MGRMISGSSNDYDITAIPKQIEFHEYALQNQNKRVL